MGVETDQGSLTGNGESPAGVKTRDLSGTNLCSFMVYSAPAPRSNYHLPPFGSRMANIGLGSCERSTVGVWDCRKSEVRKYMGWSTREQREHNQEKEGPGLHNFLAQLWSLRQVTEPFFCPF